MTRERAKELAPIIQAYGEGKKIQCTGKGSDSDWKDINCPEWLDDTDYRIKPEPKRRPMTREEMLGFVAHHPHIVVREFAEGAWMSAQCLGFSHPANYKWATITESGEIGEPQKFEVEE